MDAKNGDVQIYWKVWGRRVSQDYHHLFNQPLLFQEREVEFLNTCKQKYYSVLFSQQLLKVQHICPFCCHYQTFHFFASTCTTIQNRKAHLLTLAALEIELGEFKPTSWPRIRFTSSVPFALGTPTVNLKLY